MVKQAVLGLGNDPSHCPQRGSGKLAAETGSPGSKQAWSYSPFGAGSLWKVSPDSHGNSMIWQELLQGMARPRLP